MAEGGLLPGESGEARKGAGIARGAREGDVQGAGRPSRRKVEGGSSLNVSARAGRRWRVCSGRGKQPVVSGPRLAQEQKMATKRPKALAMKNVGTQTELLLKYAAVQVSGCSECLSLALVAEGARDTACVRCDQTSDLVRQVVELREEVERCVGCIFHTATQQINMENASSVKQFILVGLSENPGVQKICFVMFLFFYMIIVAGNLLIVITVISSQRLNSPMYFFLSYLSFVDICYSSITAPKMIAFFLVENKTISFVVCIAQLFGVHFFGCTEIFILAVMAYDRYTAIGRPLHYTTLMTRRVCSQMVMGSWLGGFMHSMVQTLLTTCLLFCGPNKIDHYFCDVHPLLQLACTNTYAVGIVVVANSGMVALSCFFILVVSYVVILVSLRICSSEGHLKALSTCTFHITVVILFFGPCIFIYMCPSTTFTVDKMVSVFYTSITLMLNPLIYTVQNEEVKNDLKILWSRKVKRSEK
ncbi:olfactory receptor 4S2-like [Alca torda]